MKTVEEMKNIIMISWRNASGQAILQEIQDQQGHGKRLSNEQFLDYFGKKYRDQTIKDHGPNDILNLFTTELNMKWVSDRKRTVLDCQPSIGGMPIVDYINGYQLSEIGPKKSKNRTHGRRKTTGSAIWPDVRESGNRPNHLRKRGTETSQKKKQVQTWSERLTK